MQVLARVTDKYHVCGAARLGIPKDAQFNLAPIGKRYGDDGHRPSRYFPRATRGCYEALFRSVNLTIVDHD